NTILMIDDDLKSQKMYKEYFEKQGYAFISGIDPVKTPIYITKGRPDIILVEIFMKKIQGHNLIITLRKKGLKTPIIVTSSRMEKMILVSLRNCNISDFFVKPVPFEKLNKKIKSVLAAKSVKSKTQQVSASLIKESKIKPSLLLITENKEIIENPDSFVPSPILQKHGFNIITRTDCQDSIGALKNPNYNVKLIMVDAAHDGRTITMVRLLKIIVGKMRIPIFFVADDFSPRLKNILSNHGFDNLISKSGAAANGAGQGFDATMVAGGKISARAYKQRQQIIKDLKSIKSLPPLPDIYLKIEELSKNQYSTPNDYSQVLELDPPITARLLRMSNSTHFAFKRKIKTVRDAVALMGIREILSLVRLACITGNLKVSPEIENTVRKIWEHSAHCAVTARLIYDRTKICKIPKLEDDLFIGGILHDIGKIILWKFFADAYMSFMLDFEAGKYPTCTDEQQGLGTTHGEVGKVLADHWKLPDNITEIIANHHRPMSSPDSELVMVIHIADFITHYIEAGDAGDVGFELNNELLEKIGYSREGIIELADNLRSVIEEKSESVSNMITG
ncbi:HDOD domain-containing protein, partial [Candidatus Omnitrophota bacterium]